MTHFGNKVVLIGAGSVVFTTSLLADFIADGGEWELRLVDISEDSVNVAYNLAKRMIAKKNSSITLKRSTDRRVLLPDADIVITVPAVGGRSAWEADIEIPRKYGIYMPVADTTTPGGISRSLRTLPVLVDIANDIIELCPNALFLNYANPMSAIVRAINRYTGLGVYGLCDGPPAIKGKFAEFLGVNEDVCDFKVVGFNHFVWLLEFLVEGKDGYPMIREKNEQIKKQGLPPGNDPDFPLAWELFELTGYFPTSRDRHITEFFPQFFAPGKGRHYGKTLGVDRFKIEPYIQGAAEEFEELRAMGDGIIPVPDSIFHDFVGEKGTARLAAGIIGALRQPELKQFHPNIPNTGQVANLKRGLVIECPVNFSQNSVVPVQLGNIPTTILSCIEHSFVTTELIVEAAMERDYKKFVEAIILDGCISSIKEAEKIADELLYVQKEHLTGW
jgi:alpha-galactosidase